jgi:maltose O-acetyltransferase
MTDLVRFLTGRFFLSLAPEGRFPGWNRLALRIMGAEVGSRAVVYSSIRISRKLNVFIGTGSFIGLRSAFVGGAGSSVSIGSNCDISDNVHFVTGTHEIDASGVRTAGLGYCKDIVVGNGVWIGYNSLILPGVKIGDNALIGAGTVVHKNVDARTVVAGSPMRKIRNLC